MSMHDHIVKSYDDEQRHLLQEILRMGHMAAAQLDAALDVVERRDDKAAERIVANDEAIDAIERRRAFVEQHRDGFVLPYFWARYSDEQRASFLPLARLRSLAAAL